MRRLLAVRHAFFRSPPALMRFAGKLTGKTAAVDRLLGSLAVDSGRIRRELGWKPPFTMTEGLKETAEWYIGGETAGRLVAGQPNREDRWAVGQLGG